MEIRQGLSLVCRQISHLVDPVGSSDRGIDLSQIAVERTGLTTAVIDGPRIYAVGPRGVLAVNARSSSILASTQWSRPLGSETTSAHGVSTVHNLSYSLNGVLAYRHNQPNQAIVSTGVAVDGVVVVPMGAQRLVAISRAADGSRPTKQARGEPLGDG